MIENRSAVLRSGRLVAALQGVALLSLTVLLIPLLSGGKGLLFLGAILVSIFAFFLLQKPEFGVLSVLTVWFIDIDPIGIRFLSIPYLVTALLLIPLALAILRDRSVWVLKVPQIQILLAIGVLFLVSSWWADFKYPITMIPELDETGRKMQLFVTRLVFLIFFLYFIRTRQWIEATVWLTIGLIVAVAAESLWLVLGGGGVARAKADFSLATNANRLSYICLFATSLLWYYRAYTQTHWLRTLTLPLLFFLPLVALATGSRSGFLQLVALGALILTAQEGRSATQRIRSFFFVSCVSVLLLLAVPTSQLMRVTSYDPGAEVRGQKSLQQRISKISAALGMIASDPILGVGIGNFRWVGRSFFYNNVGDPHNSYLWALSTGGVGVLLLYLLLFYVTHHMLRKLERAGPRELLWLSKGLRVNLLLFAIFSAFADFWLSDFLYLIMGLTIALTYLWKRQAHSLVSPHCS